VQTLSADVFLRKGPAIEEGLKSMAYVPFGESVV